MLMRDIAVGEYHLVNALCADQRLQLRLRQNREAHRVQRPRQLGRVASPGDIGDLGCREGDHLEGRVVPKHHVEVVEIPTGRAEDQDAATRHTAASTVTH